jgi:hypothetical protein
MSIESKYEGGKGDNNKEESEERSVRYYCPSVASHTMCRIVALPGAVHS